MTEAARALVLRGASLEFKCSERAEFGLAGTLVFSSRKFKFNVPKLVRVWLDDLDIGDCLKFEDARQAPLVHSRCTSLIAIGI